jgi:hypothetical protein
MTVETLHISRENKTWGVRSNAHFTEHWNGCKPNACYQSGQAKQLLEHLFAIKHDHENLSPHNLGCHYITFFDRAARNGKLDSGN